MLNPRSCTVPPLHQTILREPATLRTDLGCLGGPRALGVPPSSQAQLREFTDILDPDSDGYATYEPFFAICALQFHARAQNHSEAAHQAQLVEAFRLFTNSQEGPITLAHLRRVAAVLKEEVDDEILKDMILEANGGAGVARGVKMDEFDGVMRSAGVWR